MKYILSLSFYLICLNVIGQSVKEQIIPINTIEEAAYFIENNLNSESEILTVSPEIDINSSYKIFNSKKKGDIFSDELNTYKIIESEEKKSFRVSYIFLDGNKLTLRDINKVRAKILKKYKEGVPFVNLANEYNMDSSKDGDLGWFTEGTMVKEFETAITNHNQNDIFIIDLHNEKWYYVTLKTFSDKTVKVLTVLKIKS